MSLPLFGFKPLIKVYQVTLPTSKLLPGRLASHAAKKGRETERSKRTVALAPTTTRALRNWLELGVDMRPGAWVFASENSDKPLWRDYVWHRQMRLTLTRVGLQRDNFQVMRRMHACLGHEGSIDPKVAADQRSHGLGVALEVYTQASLEKRAEQAKLEQAVLIHEWSELE